MSTLRPSSSLLAALLAGALALACKDTDDGSPPPAECTLGQLGASCSGDDGCCSANCEGGRCVAPASECVALDGACSLPSDCCTGACNGTKCVDPTTCKAVAADCAAPGECCTGKCEADQCAEPDNACLLLEAPCTDGPQCCTGVCTSSKCAEPTTPSCRLAAVACTDHWQCCSGACDAGTCANPAGVCNTPGERCATDSDCCSQNCPNAGTAGATCSSSVCLQATQACTSDAQCCSGICGFGNRCEALPAGSTGQTCKTLGEACTLATDCCSTNCQGGACKPAASCNAFGDVCVRSEDCCSGLCAQPAAGEPGRCEDASGGCGLDGYPCASDSNCCTKKCVDLGTGATVCQPSGGCRMVGNYCDHTASCCGGTNAADPSQPNIYGVFCNGPGSTSPAAPPEWDPSAQDSRTCERGQGCNPPGDVCGYKASQNCCYEGGGSGKAVCKPDANNIMRCFGGPVNETCATGWDADDPQCCIPAGAVCQFRDQCCGFAPCVPDAQGVLRCGDADTCLPQGATCSVGGPPTTDPCCEGTSCRDIPELGWACSRELGTCRLAGQSCNASNPCCFGDCTNGSCGANCAENGTVCTANAQCCTGQCSIPPGEASGLCSDVCVDAGGTCTVTADCCTGLGCDVPAGATSGTCKAAGGGEPTCAATAQSCLGGVPCCDASETCEAGVCTPPPSCSENLQYCTFDGSTPCCEPLGCFTVDSFEARQPCDDATDVNCFCDTLSGECAPLNAPCSTLVECCGGYCAQNGTIAPCTSTDPAACTCKGAG